MNVKAKKVLTRSNELWQDLDERQSEKVMGGAEGCLAWSIGFSDVVRPNASNAPDAVYFETKGRSATGVSAVLEHNPRITGVVPM
jgi:hypothetical protein